MPIWQGHKVVVCLGTGGVGKTTVAAAIAVAAAAAGLKTLVMTIDPARRLAQALGLPDIGNTEQQVDAASLASHGVTLKGALHVMMPDVKGTFDGLISRWAPTPARAEAILRNSIYQHFSTALAGSHEYAAVEKLYEVHASGRYDLVVLDTPPSQNAMAFLQAPSRITGFLGNNAFQWLRKPTALAGKLSLKLLDAGGPLVMKLLNRLAGAQTLRALAEFIMSFEGMYEGFRVRSEHVAALLSASELAFVLVCAPTDGQRHSAEQFAQELAAQKLVVRAAVVNRVLALDIPPAERPKAQQKARGLLAMSHSSAQAAINAAIQEECLLAQRDSQAVRQLRELLGVPVIAVPEMLAGQPELQSLADMHQLFAQDDTTAAAMTRPEKP